MALAGLAKNYGSSSDDEDDDEEEEVQSCGAERPAKRTRTTIIAASHVQPVQGHSPPPTAMRAPLPPPPLDEDEKEVSGGMHSELADGRVRQFEHRDGQFAVHVFLPIKPDGKLMAGISSCCAALSRRSGSEVHPTPAAELHISLTRTTVTLDRSQIDGFPDALRVALRGCGVRAAQPRRQQPPTQQQQQQQPSLCAPVSSSFCELANETRTRHFAALELEASTPGHAALCRMIDAVDSVLARYGQPPFYAERRLHFSVAWSLTSLPLPLPPLPSSVAGSLLHFDRIDCRIGERVHDFVIS